MSLRARLALTFAAVVAISLLVAAGSLVALLRGYSTRLIQARLDDAAVVAFVQARGLLQRGQTPAQVLDYLADQAEGLEVRILLLDRQTTVVREVGRGASLAGLRIPVDFSPLRQNDPPGRQPIHGSFTSPRDGVTYLYAAVPVAQQPPRLGDPALLAVVQPEGSLLTTLGPLAPRLALAAGAGLLAGLLAAGLLARWVGRPLGRLLTATQAMTRGDYSQRVEPSGPPELARLAASFNGMAAEVERSRTIVQRFVGTLSHELRTPLTSIRGFARAVLDGSVSGPAELRRAMEIVDHESRRLQRLSAELLDLSRLQAGQVPMRREAVELAALVGQCAEVLAARAQERRVELELNLAPGLMVEGDADRLEQVFTNLLDNALKFSPPGGKVQVSGHGVGVGPSAEPSTAGEVRRFGRRTPPPATRRWTVIEVSNPGPAIPPDELPRIFEQFYTGGEGQARDGTGLGLPIAREIARAHGGDLTAESGPDRTTFRLALPGGARRDTAVTPTPLTAAPVR